MSIVSTKIPFKGAGKEYIGDDVEEMVAAVKAAIMACGLQLKVGRPPGRGGGTRAAPLPAAAGLARRHAPPILAP